MFCSLSSPLHTLNEIAVEVFNEMNANSNIENAIQLPTDMSSALRIPRKNMGKREFS